MAKASVELPDGRKVILTDGDLIALLAEAEETGADSIQVVGFSAPKSWGYMALNGLERLDKERLAKARTARRAAVLMEAPARGAGPTLSQPVVIQLAVPPMPAPIVNVHVPQGPAPVVNNTLSIPEDAIRVTADVNLPSQAKRLTVQRDQDGNIKSATIAPTYE